VAFGERGAISDGMTIPPLPDGPHDIEFFFDPGCPFAWQTSVWIRRVAELEGVRIGWRFISLRFINEGDPDQPPALRASQELGLRFHRICAAAREAHGNDAVGALYRSWGEHYWYQPGEGDLFDRIAAVTEAMDPAKVVEAAGLPASLLDAADDPSWDALIRAETEEAFERTGEGVGTPIITYVSSGTSLFGPVISYVPDDEQAVELYRALRTMADFPGFSELKRTKRPPLDLPLLADA